MTWARRCVVGAAALFAAALFAVACGDDEAAGPSSDTVNGVQYSAQVQESVAANGRTLFLVSVSLRNITNAVVTRRYPVGCAVQIRFYNPANGQMVYDESTRPCTPPDSLTVTIPSGSTVTLSSGLRYPTTITAIIPAAEYDVRAFARTESPDNIEVRAGRYTIPLYNDG